MTSILKILISTGVFFLFSISSLAAKQVNLNCISKEKQKMSFSLNFDTEEITFSNVEAFGYAQIKNNDTYKISVSDNPAVVQFTYTWYYDANYELKFDQSLVNLTDSSQVNLVLNGNDNDGSVFTDEAFVCRSK